MYSDCFSEESVAVEFFLFQVDISIVWFFVLLVLFFFFEH